MSSVGNGVVVKAGATTAGFADSRVSSNKFLKKNLNKLFPEHWSFMLGEIALYSFIVILLTGVYLTLFFKPSVTEVIYNGSYAPLNGIAMSEAYASTLDISFDVSGGLLMRQIHHWAALLFVAAISVHLMRVFFTGAFRKPRELNWVIGVVLLTLALGAGFTGYSLPDDLLSGTGLRIIEGILLSIPVIGTWASSFVFGGEFPGVDIIPRLYGMHILLVPGLILGLVTAHLMMVWYQKHTQFPGAGRTEDNVVGYRLFPIYTAKAGGFFFIVFGAIALLGGLVTINPVWAYGPYRPDNVTAGSQPDWYIGWLEGALRVMPNWESVIFGFTFSWNVLIPSVIIPGVIFTLMGLYPLIERWATGDTETHNLLDRPRDNPTRTALGVMGLTFYGVLWVNGGNDIIAVTFDLSINTITWAARVLLFVAPPIAFMVTKRICISLQRRDRDLLLHGRETGRIRVTPDGEFYEVHEPVDAETAAIITGRADYRALPEPRATDDNGVALPNGRIQRLRTRLSRFYYGDQIPTPTAEEIEAAQHHAHGEVEAAEAVEPAAVEAAETAGAEPVGSKSEG
jgi:ubiquinol-cytochrome c reductase cytochrome b subunit